MPRETSVERPVNVAGRMRSKEAAYASWYDPFMGWKWFLLKSWQVDNGKPTARWMVYADSEFAEMGDMYVKELWSGVEQKQELVFDTTIWSSEEDFIEWAKGSA